MMLALLLLACAPSTDTGAGADLGTCDASGGRSFWALSALRFAPIEDNISDGFDLDGDETEAGDSSGCGVGDAVSPSGTGGIDNAFGRMLPALESTEFAAADGLLAAMISSGELLLVAEVSGIDDWSDDGCVSAAMYRGIGAPMLTTDGFILPDQTLELDQGFDNQFFPQTTLESGSVEGRPLNTVMPLQILDASFDFPLTKGAIRYDLHADGTMSGVLAGGIGVEYLVDLLNGEAGGVDDSLAALFESLLPVLADLEPDASGACTRLSATMAFDAVPIFVYEDTLD
jgi:hypothetical protein